MCQGWIKNSEWGLPVITGKITPGEDSVRLPGLTSLACDSQEDSFLEAHPHPGGMENHARVQVHPARK